MRVHDVPDRVPTAALGHRPLGGGVFRRGRLQSVRPDEGDPSPDFLLEPRGDPRYGLVLYSYENNLLFSSDNSDICFMFLMISALRIFGSLFFVFE